MKYTAYLKAFVFLVALCVLGCDKESITEPLTDSTDYQTLKFRKDGYPKYPTLDVYSIAPCGYGFTVEFYYIGTGTLAFGIARPYTIFDSSGALVDSGTVVHGGSTNWVLGPCQVYTIDIYAGPITGTVSITLTSDGCGGLFLC